MGRIWGDFVCIRASQERDRRLGSDRGDTSTTATTLESHPLLIGTHDDQRGIEVE